MSGALRVGIVGAGPRGLSVLERLLAHARRCREENPAAEVSLDIRLFDPFPPGPGRVWRTDQSPHLLMNTVVEEQTVFPDASCRVSVPGTGPSMAEWARSADGAGSAEEENASAPATATFAQRREYGAYLADAYDRMAAQAPPGVTIAHEPCEVLQILDLPENASVPSGPGTRSFAGVHRPAPTRGPASQARDQEAGVPPLPEGRTLASAPQALRLSDGRTLEADAVVLCVGHIPAALSDERAGWQRFADAANLVYLPPGLPAETRVDRLPAGEPVLIRGFGLNYFDLQSLLTHGRGGRFEETGEGELRYLPSGSEPILVPGSRRGVPYRSKPLTSRHPLPVPPGSHLRFFTAEHIDRLPAPEAGLRFDAQLWPLVLADLRRAWYAALARSRPEVFREDPAVLDSALAEAVARHLDDGGRSSAARTSAVTGTAPVPSTPAAGTAAGAATPAAESWRETEERVLDPDAVSAEPGLLLDLHRYIRPLGHTGFADREELRGALLAYLREDLAASRLGPALSPEKALFPVLWQARMLLKELVAQERLEPASFVAEVRGWFEDFVSGICDGPPPQRYAELIALAEAGLVDFAGPEVRIRTSRTGEPAGFVATTSAVDGEVRARALVDASSPANRVTQADDRLIRGMLDRGQLRVAEHRLDPTTVVPSSGLAVTRPPYRTVDARGRVHPARFVLSLQLSSVQLGLAIAANPDSDARTFRDADAVARAILDLC
ncbi:FAD/NAD(P)-binding protein [Brevibacterium salitolerans]|uniref:FAD-dependent urate hydroxylase HpyO/Asp monooxygenase CreE-like FAD/NAD(P)-binding domain-containing protein n=1 Tax=Brevibacterium salitolerans TaxID=1403566 RepID=A0ABN2WN41_9MICO